jgi:hypothetical protein
MAAMPDAAPSPETFFKAFGLLSHLYLTPVLGALIEGGVPDHLDAGPLSASELAERAGLHALTVTRSLRALAAFGAFQEVSPGVFANTPVSDFFRDRPGGIACAGFRTSTRCSIARWQICAATNTSGSPGPTTGPA